MSLQRDIKKDVAAAKKIPTPWWAAVSVIVGTFFIGWLFDSWGKLSLVSPLLNTVVVVGFVLAVKWRQNRQAWFWAATTLMLAVHALALAFVPWGETWTPALVIGVIDSLDICLMLAVFEIARRLWRAQI
jgi:hypothetical protein